MREKVEKGELGLKSGRGFYEYDSRDVGEYERARLASLVAVLDLLGLRPGSDLGEGVPEPSGEPRR